MRVFVRFVAFASKVPKTKTPIDMEDSSSVEDVLKRIWETWTDELKEYQDINSFMDHVLAASDHQMLEEGDRLHDNQEIVIVGQIIGG